MVIAVDTNVVLSAILFPGGTAAAFMREAFSDHTVVFGSFVLYELRSVFERKFPERLPALETFFEIATYLTANSEQSGKELGGFEIRDPKDREVVAGALLANADCLVTGDRDIEPEGWRTFGQGTSWYFPSRSQDDPAFNGNGLGTLQQMVQSALGMDGIVRSSRVTYDWDNLRAD